jgi:hypothetical protein
VASTWVVKAVDILKECGLDLPPGPPLLTPDQLSLHSLEEGFYHCIIVAITFTAHRHFERVAPQLLLIIMAAILAAAIRMMNAPIREKCVAAEHRLKP